jgi:Predicted flavin-nucleotide-binding protein
MRRKEREIKDTNKIREIIEQCQVCRMAMLDGDRPYIVPLSFGFEWGEEPSFYFHGANVGKKIDLLRQNAKVCLEFDTNVNIVQGDTACDYSTCYQSVIAHGEVLFLELEEKQKALDKLMLQYTKRKGFSYPKLMFDRMAMYKVVVSEITAKENMAK